MKLQIHFAILICLLLLGAGCSATQEYYSPNTATNPNYVDPFEGTKKTEKRDLSRNSDDFFVDIGAGSETEDDGTTPDTDQAIDGSASYEISGPRSIKLRFVNKLTGRGVAGHLVSCSGCQDFDQAQGREADLDGRVDLTIEADRLDSFSISPLRTGWNTHNPIRQVDWNKDEIVVDVTPLVVDIGQEIYFPTVTYTRNSLNRRRLHITYKDGVGRILANSMIRAHGPIDGSKRVVVSATTDPAGQAFLDLPVSGAYRIPIFRGLGVETNTRFFQFEAASGYDFYLNLDLSKIPEMFSGTEALSKDYIERGMILVCARDSRTNKAVYSNVNIPRTNISFTKTVKHNNDVCVEVPQSYEEVYLPVTGFHGGHAVVSTSGVDTERALYLYVEKK